MMAVHENSLANLKPWSKGVSGNPSGRPRKLITELEDQLGVHFQADLKKQDYYHILQSMLEMGVEQLIEVGRDRNVPIFMVTCARAIVDDMLNNRMTTVDSLFDRLFGKPKQVNELVGKDEGPLTFMEVKNELNEFYTGGD